jgi:hypothetical protein
MILLQICLYWLTIKYYFVFDVKTQSEQKIGPADFRIKLTLAFCWCNFILEIVIKLELFNRNLHYSPLFIN